MPGAIVTKMLDGSFSLATEDMTAVEARKIDIYCQEHDYIMSRTLQEEVDPIDAAKEELSSLSDDDARDVVDSVLEMSDKVDRDALNAFYGDTT